MRVFLLSFFFFFLIVSDKLQEFGIPFPAGSRHILIFIFVSFLFIISKYREINLAYLFVFLALVSISIISFIFNEVSLLSFLISLFISFIFAYCVLLQSGAGYTQREIEKISLFILLSVMICGLPGLLNYLINGVPIRLSPGLFREAGAFATAHVVACIIALAFNLQTNKKKFLYIAIFISVIIIITGLKKSMASMVLCWLIWCYFKKVRFYKFFVISGIIGILLSPIYLQIFLDDIQNNLDYFNNVGAQGHIRIAMYIGAINIFSDNILFGTGLGSFGSLGSLVLGFEWPGRIIYGFSDVYYEYGLIGLAGVNETSINNGTGTTYLDTYWPHIVAELGLLGLIPFLLLWFYPLYISLKIHFSKNPYNLYTQSCIFMLISICLVLSWEGLFLIMPEVPAFIFLHSIFTGSIISSLRQTNIQNH